MHLHFLLFFKNLTSTYALVSETLKRVALLRSLLSDSNLFPKLESQQLTKILEESEHFSNKLSTDDCLYLVIAYEVLFGHSNQVAATFPNHPVVTSRANLASLLTKNQGNFPADSNSSNPAFVPKYVRIIGLKNVFTSVSKTFINLGFEQIPLPVCDSEQFRTFAKHFYDMPSQSSKISTACFPSQTETIYCRC